MSNTNPKVDAFLGRATKWQAELTQLRAIALACELTEELKWGKPCYVAHGSNVVILQGFKAFCALLFPKGALLGDPNGLMEKPGENTQAARRICFTDVQEIVMMENILKDYIREAIDVEKAGLKVTLKKASEFPIPAELQVRFDELPALRSAFHLLTPGRQRAYLLHFSAAKQSKTRDARIEKCIPRILDGLGLND